VYPRQKIRHVVEILLETTGIVLSNGAGIPELVRFREHFPWYKIVVYRCPSCDNIIFEGKVNSTRRLNILFEDVERHYHVIANLTGPMSCIKDATNRVNVTSRTLTTRRVATTWPVPVHILGR